MKVEPFFQPDPFGVSLEFTEEFMNDDFDQIKKSKTHTNRLNSSIGKIQNNEVEKNEENS